jgi:hypothetical protein
MSLILAVEPDHHRAAQLSALSRAHLDAELIVAPNAEQALHALHGRVPEVMLTAPLLPPRDEAELARFLRELGPSAAHVHALTIPLLAEPGDTAARPALSTFRRERTRPSEVEGCLPADFARQIAEYLKGATGHQRRPIVHAGPSASMRPPADPDALPSLDAAPAVEPAVIESAPRPEPELTPVLEIDEFSIDTIELEDPPSNSTPPAPSVELLDPVDEEIDLSPMLDTPPSPTPALPPALRKTRRLRDLPPIVDLGPIADASASLDADPILDAAPVVERRRVEPAAPEPVNALIPLAAAPQAPPGTVQQIIAIPTGDGTQVQAAVNVAVAVSVQVAAAVTVAPQPKRPRKPRPIQDEWGFFDPGQCGFPALMARLDEIAAKADAEDDDN